MSPGRGLFLFLFFIVLILVAVGDIRTRKIPDRLVAAAGLLGILSVPYFPEIGWLERGIGMFCISIPLFLLAVIVPGSFGGGDIKLMAAGGFFLGWERVLAAFALAVLLGGIYAVWLLAVRKES